MNNNNDIKEKRPPYFYIVLILLPIVGIVCGLIMMTSGMNGSIESMGQAGTGFFIMAISIIVEILFLSVL